MCLSVLIYTQISCFMYTQICLFLQSHQFRKFSHVVFLYMMQYNTCRDSNATHTTPYEFLYDPYDPTWAHHLIIWGVVTPQPLGLTPMAISNSL